MIRSDVDWAALRAEWEAGASGYSLAQRFDLARQSIAKRQRKEGWQRTGDAEALAGTDTARRLARPATPNERRDARPGGRAKRSMSAAQRLLDMAASGATITLMSKRLSMSRDALADWLQSDPALAAEMDAARAEVGLSLIRNIVDAASRDWRAALAMLERLDMTREDFAVREPQAPPGRIEVNVILPPDLSAMLSAARPAAAVIEHEPVAAGGGAQSEGDEAA